MMEYSTYYLQPAGMKRSYDHTMDKYLEKDAILDIDAILGIERDEPVLSNSTEDDVYGNTGGA